VFLVISWDSGGLDHTEDGVRGYDGTATYARMVVRLTTALAERAFKLAEATAPP
jgi:hypothetical protein